MALFYFCFKMNCCAALLFSLAQLLLQYLQQETKNKYFFQICRNQTHEKAFGEPMKGSCSTQKAYEKTMLDPRALLKASARLMRRSRSTINSYEMNFARPMRSLLLEFNWEPRLFNFGKYWNPSPPTTLFGFFINLGLD